MEDKDKSKSDCTSTYGMVESPLSRREPQVCSGVDEESNPNSDNKIRQISIEQLNRGYIVRVGCHSFAIGTKRTLLEKLTNYITNPILTEKIWFDDNLF